jgi:rhodanese-related sulfurtransferase
MVLLDILGLGSKPNNISEYVANGAVIVDVRTTGEFSSGHIKGSKNIALDGIASKVSEIKKWNKPVIVCCRSGMRSAQAASILKQNGIDVINGGGWESLQQKLK